MFLSPCSTSCMSKDRISTLYTALSGKDAPFPGDVKWNFGKFLISRDGKILARFDSNVTPDSKELTDAIGKALAAK